MTSVGVDQTTCTNCGTPLAGPYCGSCGQKAAPPNPSVGDFVHELAHELVHVDGKIIQSLRLLITAPGRLTKDQFAGRRVRYVSPIRLYLTFSVVYFAVAALTPDVNFHISVGGKRAQGFSFQNPAERAQSSPDELRRLGFESQRQLEATANEAIVHWTPRALFLLVPVFAAMTGLMLRRTGRNYPQHLYFALHVHAAWFLMLAVGAAFAYLPERLTGVGLVVPLWMFVYLVLALRRAYGITFPSALWRAAVVGAAYAVLLLAAMISIVLPAVLSHH